MAPNMYKARVLVLHFAQMPRHANIGTQYDVTLYAGLIKMTIFWNMRTYT